MRKNAYEPDVFEENDKALLDMDLERSKRGGGYKDEPDEKNFTREQLDALSNALDALEDGLNSAETHGVDDYTDTTGGYRTLAKAARYMERLAFGGVAEDLEEIARKLEKIKLPHAMKHIQKAVKILRDAAKQ